MFSNPVRDDVDGVHWDLSVMFRSLEPRKSAALSIASSTAQNQNQGGLVYSERRLRTIINLGKKGFEDKDISVLRHGSLQR